MRNFENLNVQEKAMNQIVRMVSNKVLRMGDPIEALDRCMFMLYEPDLPEGLLQLVINE
jgi:hypothetical protein